MTTTLLIDATPIDINDDVAFALNFSVADIREPDKRKTSFSKTITIPGTPANNTFFQHIYEIGSNDGFNPNVKVTAQLLNGGAQTFKGYCQLKNIIRQYDNYVAYEIVLFGELGDLFNSMGNDKISDLDLSELDHTPTLTNVQSSWSNTTGYTYALVNNGNWRFEQTLVPTVNITGMSVCAYAKTIWDKIFTTHGFTYESSWLSGQPFTKLIMPSFGKPLVRSVTITGSVLISGNVTLTGDTTTYTLRAVKRTSGGQQIVLASTTGNATGDFQVTVALTPGTFTVEPGHEIYIDFYWNSSDASAVMQLKSGAFQGYYGDGAMYGASDWYATFTTPYTQTINTTAIVHFDTEIEDEGGNYNNSTYKETVPAIPFEKIIPNMLQKDFVMDIVKMFNLYIDPDPDVPKNLIIAPRDTYYAGGTLQDWQKKIDMSQEWTQQPMPFLNFKEHRWKYKDDDDFFNKLYRDGNNISYGQKNFEVDSDFQTDTQVYELHFAPTVSVQGDICPMVLPSIIKENPIDIPIGNYFSGSPRILYYGGLKSVSSGWFLTDGSNTATLTTYPFASHVDDPNAPTVDILFDTPKVVYWTINPDSYTANNLYNVYYSKFIEEITDRDSKLLTCYLYLTNHDIQKFSFRNKVFLLGHEFRVNKIIDFDPVNPKVTKVELLKIIEGSTWTSSNTNVLTGPDRDYAENITVLKSPIDGVFYDNN